MSKLIQDLQDGRITLAEAFKIQDQIDQDGQWLPASGGTEVPFMTRTGRRLLYCYQASTGRHAYLCCDSDLILSDQEAANCLGI